MQSSTGGSKLNNSVDLLRVHASLKSPVTVLFKCFSIMLLCSLLLILYILDGNIDLHFSNLTADIAFQIKNLQINHIMNLSVM